LVKKCSWCQKHVPSAGRRHMRRGGTGSEGGYFHADCLKEYNKTIEDVCNIIAERG
jgi:hypothetical protein